MKQLVPLSLLATCALVLAGCGAVPRNSTPSAKLGTSPAAPDAPAANSGASTAGSNNGGSSSATGSQPAPQAAPAPSSSLPTPPSDATVYDQVQNTDGWESCSLCAQGTNTTDNYWTATNQSSPSMSGSSRQFYVGGPQWSNALFWKTYREKTDTTHFLWDFYVYWDEKSMANIWTTEFDFWQSIDGREFMIGSQCNFGDGYWDIWDNKANQWLHSDVHCQRMEPGKWHHIQWYMERLGNEHYRYNTLVVDGESHDINRTFDPNPIDWKDTMGIQWQLDQSSSGVDIHEWIDNVKLTVW
jgi:hypothetical protein